jgi:hypothetical protein
VISATLITFPIRPDAKVQLCVTGDELFLLQDALDGTISSGSPQTMPDGRSYDPFRPATARQDQDGEPVWSLRQEGGTRLQCELRAHGDYGVEVQLYVTPVRERNFLYGHTWPSRELALAEAEEIRVKEVHEGGTMIELKGCA